MRRNYDDRSTTSKHDVSVCTSFLYIAKIGPRFSKTLLYKHISAHHRVLMAKLECTENKHILLSRCAKHTCPLFWGGMILKNCSLLGCLRHKPCKVNICTCWRTLFSEHSRSKKDNTQDAPNVLFYTEKYHRSMCRRRRYIAVEWSCGRKGENRIGGFPKPASLWCQLHICKGLGSAF